MTPADFRAIRLAALPTSSAAQFARIIGYRNTRSYDQYERERRIQNPPPALVSLMATLDLATRHGLVNEWVEAARKAHGAMGD